MFVSDLRLDSFRIHIYKNGLSTDPTELLSTVYSMTNGDDISLKLKLMFFSALRLDSFRIHNNISIRMAYPLARLNCGPHIQYDNCRRCFVQVILFTSTNMCNFASPTTAFTTMTDEANPLPAELRRRAGDQRAAAPESIPAQPTALVVNENENVEHISSPAESSVMNVIESDRIFHQATVLSVLLLSPSIALRPVCIWLLLFASAYAITPSDHWEYLQAVAAYALVVSLFFVLTYPLGLLQVYATEPSHSSRCFRSKWTCILVVAVAVPFTAVVGAIFCDQKDKIKEDL
jgi:hypothetical protein